ncbi:MAG: alpha/beta fold hydrolase, partial [Cytophagaceae bacterium]
VAPLFYTENRSRLKEQVAAMTAIAASSSTEGVIEATKAMRDRQDRTHVLRNTALPVLFIIGKQDTAVLLEKSLEQCHLPAHSTACFLDHNGHMGMFENPEESVRIIERFLS